jgi:hypothetical protein
MEIVDPRNGDKAYVDSTHRLTTRAITETESQLSTEEGTAFNINSGKIALTTSTESGILYYKHNEDDVLIVEALAVGVGSAGTTTDVSEITIVKNPTAGTLISGAVAVPINQNRNFGSSLTLSESLAYKGAEGSTITDGDDYLYFFQPPGGRLFATVNTELTKGDSIAVKVDTNTSSGTTNVYAALVVHTKKFDA